MGKKWVLGCRSARRWVKTPFLPTLNPWRATCTPGALPPKIYGEEESMDTLWRHFSSDGGLVVTATLAILIALCRPQIGPMARNGKKRGTKGFWPHREKGEKWPKNGKNGPKMDCKATPRASDRLLSNLLRLLSGSCLSLRVV